MEQRDAINNQDLKSDIQEKGISNYELLNFLSQRVLSFFDNKTKDNKTKVNNYTITGGWGTGKTQLLKRLENFLNKQNQNDVKFIWLNLWKYELFNEQEIFMKIISKLLIKINNSEKNWINKAWKFIKKLGTSINFSFSLPIIKVFGLEIGIDKKSINNIFEDNDFKNDMFQLIKEFTELLDSLASKIVVVFDDLDRCQENKILNILTAIKNFFFEVKSHNLFYFTALNEKYINEILNCKTENEKYTTKIFLKENKLNIENLIKYDSYDSLINSNQLVIANNQILENVFEVIYQQFKNIFSQMNFREINSELGFICDFNFQEKVEKLSTESEIIDLIFLEFLKRKHFLKWNEFQTDLIDSSYKFIEKIIWEEKIVNSKILNPIEEESNIPKKQQIVADFWERHSWEINSIYYYGMTTKASFLVEFSNEKFFSFSDFAFFFKKTVDVDELFKMFEEKRNSSFLIYVISFDDLKEMLDDYFFIYFNSQIKINKNDFIYNVVPTNVGEFLFFKKILSADGTF